MEFEVGDKVIYPNHGLGVVEKIEEKTILGTTCGFYSLRMTASDTTVLVPVDNVEDVGLRRAIADTEVKRLFTQLGNGKIDNHQNWKGRFKDNSDKMRTGSIRDVIDVLKSLNFLSKSKNLSFREKRMLDRAKFLVVSEISEVTGEGSDDIEDKVEKALDRCLVNRVRVLDRAKAAKVSKNARSAKTTVKLAKPATGAKSPKTAKVTKSVGSSPTKTARTVRTAKTAKSPTPAVKGSRVSKVAKVSKATKVAKATSAKKAAPRGAARAS